MVTKTYPASDVRILSELGVRHVAENRDQDAAPKAAECSGLPLTWHFVGQLQTNKVRSVVGYAGIVQSVDRARLVTALSKEAVRTGREVGCLIQVALDADESGRGARGGVGPDGIEELGELVAKAPGLRLDGLMTVAPLTGPYAGREQAAFERLMDLSTDLRRTHPAANMVSAGMSSTSNRPWRPERHMYASAPRYSESVPGSGNVAKKSDHSRKYGHYRRKRA